ncbi:hypothetical protein AVEN_199674-1 [Araneus ventricosus]|uniref:Uncharacterized protein n=1 Tax=Araneus ventricosus TaxID=182803 RepID=A0A4Y2DHU5_ARAVE|nr:hypothetical protein AVEN_199674-1 [Araneus ventricosus]
MKEQTKNERISSGHSRTPLCQPSDVKTGFLPTCRQIVNFKVRKRVQQGPTSPFSIHFSCTESQPSRVNGLRRHGLAPPNPASPARSDLPFAAKPQSPRREPGGPSSFLQSQKPLSLSSEPKTSLSETADNQNSSHRPQTGEKYNNFRFKGQLEGGKAEFLQCARIESQKGSGVSRKFPSR